MIEESALQIDPVAAQVRRAANAHRRRKGNITKRLESWRSLCKRSPGAAAQWLHEEILAMDSYLSDARAICEATGYDLETGRSRPIVVASPHIKNANVARTFAQDPAHASFLAIRMCGIITMINNKVMSVLSNPELMTDPERIERSGIALLEASLSEPHLMDLLGIEELTHEKHQRYAGAAASSLSGLLATRISVTKDEPKNRRIVAALMQDQNPGETLVQTLERQLPGAVFEVARKKQPTDLRSLRTDIQNLLEHRGAIFSVEASPIKESHETIAPTEEFIARDEAKREKHWAESLADLRANAGLTHLEGRVLDMYLAKESLMKITRSLGPTKTLEQVEQHMVQVRKKLVRAAGLAA